MNQMLYFFYFSIINLALVLSLLGLLFTAFIPGIDRWTKHFFLSYFFVFMLCSFSGLIEIILAFYSVTGTVLYVTLILETVLLALPLPMVTVYLLHCCREDFRSSRLLRASIGLWALHMVMLATDPFFHGFASLTPDGIYIRGALYPFLLLPLVVLLMLNLAKVIRSRDRLSRKTFLSFLVAILPMMIALIIHLFAEAYPLFDISFVLSGLSMYCLILADQIEQDRIREKEITRQELEIANQRASIMVLQMRPHFIYNTMTSIYCLCDQDPKLARQVIMDFTAYLRKNFTAIASKDPIPFSSELEHIRAYLAVEQALYEDSLAVDFDTPHSRFRVPPLTLQPIVENAVKHGRDPYAGPFHISIRTRKTDTGSEVVISDNGRGFEPAPDSEPHIALENIRQRLEIMCGGHLAITPNDGGGTVVTLTIPDKPAA